jgi:uncharacterized glyoxalase superfamily protein PhnB
MPKPEAISPAIIIPALRYRDAPAAIEFLCAAFGFSRHLVVPGEGDRIEHAQLTLGSSMVMLGSVREEDLGFPWKQPREVGAVTQTIYVIVPDPDAHYRQAKAGGAEILREVTDQDYGGRLYTCRDLEGHVWSFGSYDPWH